MVDRIIRFTVQTGLLTLIVTGLGLLFYLTSPKGTYLLLNFITSKLYTSSLLSSLNSRQGCGYDTSKNNDEEFDLSTDLGLRFVSNFQSVDETSSVNSGADLEASVTHISDPLSKVDVTK